MQGVIEYASNLVGLKFIDSLELDSKPSGLTEIKRTADFMFFKFNSFQYFAWSIYDDKYYRLVSCPIELINNYLDLEFVATVTDKLVPKGKLIDITNTAVFDFSLYLAPASSTYYAFINGTYDRLITKDDTEYKKRREEALKELKNVLHKFSDVADVMKTFSEPLKDFEKTLAGVKKSS